MYFAQKTKRGWRVFFDQIDICGAIDQSVAQETAAALNDFRGIRRTEGSDLRKMSMLAFACALGSGVRT